MEYRKNNQTTQTQHVRRNLNDPREFNRLLMQYGGIFKHNIKDFADTISKHKPIKNFSK